MSPHPTLPGDMLFDCIGEVTAICIKPAHIRNETLELLEMMEEEKVPWFHIFAQVDYSGLFPVCRLFACYGLISVVIHTHIHHAVTQAHSGFGSCAGMQSLFPQVSSLPHCSLFNSVLPSCFSFFLCAMNISGITLMSLTMCVRHASCGLNPSHWPL